MQADDTAALNGVGSNFARRDDVDLAPCLTVHALVAPGL